MTSLNRNIHPGDSWPYACFLSDQSGKDPFPNNTDLLWRCLISLCILIDLQEDIFLTFLFGHVFANCSNMADVPFHDLAFEAGPKPVSKLSRLSEFRTNFSINPFAAKFHLEACTFKTSNNLKHCSNLLNLTKLTK